MFSLLLKELIFIFLFDETTTIGSNGNTEISDNLKKKIHSSKMILKCGSVLNKYIFLKLKFINPTHIFNPTNSVIVAISKAGILLRVWPSVLFIQYSTR